MHLLSGTTSHITAFTPKLRSNTPLPQRFIITTSSVHSQSQLTIQHVTLTTSGTMEHKATTGLGITERTTMGMESETSLT
jgi:hypothetical protein